MTSLEDKVFQCSSGEKRLNPDELRQYFGTYAERVVLAVLLEDAEKKIVIEHFPLILKKLLAVYPNLSLKLSPNLSDQTQFTYIKGAQTLNISATIVDEAKAHSPYGIVVIVIRPKTLIRYYSQSSILIFLLPSKLSKSLKKEDFLLSYLENNNI